MAQAGLTRPGDEDESMTMEDMTTNYVGLSPRVRRGAALTDLIGGQVRGLAVSTAKRSATAPELPTIGETVPGYEVTTWTALYAPAGTPREMVQRRGAEMAKLQKLPDYAERLGRIGSGAS